jgi:polysaccharide export outer membrane protein
MAHVLQEALTRRERQVETVRVKGESRMKRSHRLGRSEKEVLAHEGLRCLLVSFALLCGCSSSEPVVLSEPIVAAPVSYTDEVSRRLAAGTFQRLPEMYQDYRVGAEDVLEISIFEWELREETKSVEIRVSETGLIGLPVIGDMNVMNLTVEEIKANIEKRLKDWQIIPNPRVSVVVMQFRSKRVAVVGAVRDPGTYTLRSNVTTLLDILSLAGGPDARAGQVAYVIRDIRPVLPDDDTPPAEGASSRAGIPFDPGAKEVISIDLYELLELGDLSLNVLVSNGDVVNVPEAKRFHVIGFARDPGSFPLKKPTTVLEGIALARGFQEIEASKRHCVVKRKTPDGEYIIPVDLVAVSSGEAPNFYLQPDDIIYVRQTTMRRTLLYAYDIVTKLFTFTGSIFRL